MGQRNLGICGGTEIRVTDSGVSLGMATQLTWTSTNATACTASGAWSGTQNTSGTSSQTPTASGTSSYTLSCTGAGGTTSQTVGVIVPIPVQKSSYENRATADEAIGPQLLPSETHDGNAVAFADFFQDGSYSMVTHSLEYNPADPTTSNKVGHVHFYKQVGGAWVDHTSDLLSATAGCLHPRKAIVADFNGDGKPDVYFACHGFDASPFPGEQPHMLLSQSDGTYKNVTLPNVCYCHGAAAADAAHTGYADVLVTNNTVSPHVPFFLINNKDGTFTSDTTRLPAGVLGEPVNKGLYWGQIFTVELVDFDNVGRYDAFLAGTEPDGHFGNWLPTIFKNDGTGHYVNKVTLPVDPQFVTTLDMVFKNGNIYLNRVKESYDANVYGTSAIQKISYPGMVASEIYKNTTNFLPTPGWAGTTWLNWIVWYQGKIESLDSAYGVSVPQ